MLQFLKANALIIILIIGVIILLFVLLKGRKSYNQNLIDQLIAAKDSVIKKEGDKVILYERLIEEKDRTNEVLQQRDSVLNAHYSESVLTYKKINEKLRNIPDRVVRASTSNDSLRLLLSREF